jgi:hypothetical protein
MSEKRPLGDICDKLGVTARLADDDLVTDVYAIVKVLEPNGETRLTFCWSDGISWVERLGMVTVAQAIETPPPRHSDGA